MAVKQYTQVIEKGIFMILLCMRRDVYKHLRFADSHYCGTVRHVCTVVSLPAEAIRVSSGD